MPVQVGEALGRYQLEQQVGQGGMAIVYRAVDSVLGRTVAVKVIRPAFTEDPMFLERFLQEARVVASLDHPNILPLFDFGEEKGQPYLVLPYLPGGSLADRLSSQPQPLPLVAAWLIQLAGALDAAHARGVLHRDIKPGNVLVTKDGRLVLGDFGIAKLAEATTHLTATGMVVGTPLYMAPELARGAAATPASDRYALAVMAFEMIAGLPPFVGSNPLSVLHQQVHEPVPSLTARLPELPAGIDGFLRRAMAKNPAARHPSSRAMAEELVQLLSEAQRAELSTLVWAGGAEGGSVSAAEAPTVVEGGRTLRMSGPGGPARPAPTGQPRSRSVPTSAVTAEAPRARRGSPLLWGLAGMALLAAVMLLVPREWLNGGRAPAPQPARAPAGAPAPAGAAAGAPGTAPAQAAGGQTATASGAPPVAAQGGGVAPPPPAPGSAGPVPPPAPAGAMGEPAPPAGAAAGPLAGLAQGARGKLQLLRRPAGRMTAAGFQRLLDGTAELAGNPRAMQTGIAIFRDWARGGLAYAQGDAREAASVAEGLRAESGSAPWSVAWPATVFHEGKPWDLAGLYADPRREMQAMLEPKLPGVADKWRTALAAAYLAHLDGDHRGAIDFLLGLGMDPASGVGAGAGKALLAQLLVAEATELGDGVAVRRWLPFALEQGRAPFAQAFSLEMVGLAGEKLGPAEAMAMKNEACRIGVRQLCQPAFGQEQPQLPVLKPDRLGGRRRRGPGGGPGGDGGGGGGG